MNTETILTILGLLGVGTIIGSFITYKLESKKESKRIVLENKEKQYKTFLENLIGFFDGWEDVNKKEAFMKELYTHAPLYASDEVIKLANEFLKSFQDMDLERKGKSDTYYRKLVIAIREDLKRILNEKSKLIEDDIDIQKLNK